MRWGVRERREERGKLDRDESKKGAREIGTNCAALSVLNGSHDSCEPFKLIIIYIFNINEVTSYG
jgi:hypothetical protein